MKGEYNDIDYDKERKCEKTGKICYSQKVANRVVHCAKWSKAKKTPKRVYYCAYCGTYHLTHIKNKRKGSNYGSKKNVRKFSCND